MQTDINFLAEYADLEPFAAEVNRDPRTVRRWMNAPDGLPYARIGNRILIHIPSAREWLNSKLRKPNPRRTAPARRGAGRATTQPAAA